MIDTIIQALLDKLDKLDSDSPLEIAEERILETIQELSNYNG